MHRSLRILPAVVAFGALALPADAVPRPETPAPYAVRLGCDVKLAPRTPTNHKAPTAYIVLVVDTLGRALAAGTTVQYGVSFSDGTSQNGTTMLVAPVAPGSAESVGAFTPPLAPTACTAGIPPVQGDVPSSGSGGYIPVSSSPRPVLHEI